MTGFKVGKDIFVNQLLVDGSVVSGRIVDGKFYMISLNPSSKVKPPLSREIEFDKEWLELTIKELQAIQNKL